MLLYCLLWSFKELVERGYTLVPSSYHEDKKHTPHTLYMQRHQTRCYIIDKINTIWRFGNFFLNFHLNKAQLNTRPLLRLAVALLLVSSRLVWHVYPVLKAMPQKRFPPFLNILPSWPRATAVASRAIKSHLTASLNTGCRLNYRVTDYRFTAAHAHLWINFLTTSIPPLSSLRARMYSWVKRRRRGHFPKSWQQQPKAELGMYHPK